MQGVGGRLSPLYYYIELSYGTLLKGTGADVLRRPMLVLACLGALLFGFGVWRFRRQFG